MLSALLLVGWLSGFLLGSDGVDIELVPERHTIMTGSLMKLDFFNSFGNTIVPPDRFILDCSVEKTFHSFLPFIGTNFIKGEFKVAFPYYVRTNNAGRDSRFGGLGGSKVTQLPPLGPNISLINPDIDSRRAACVFKYCYKWYGTSYGAVGGHDFLLASNPGPVIADLILSRFSTDQSCVSCNLGSISGNYGDLQVVIKEDYSNNAKHKPKGGKKVHVSSGLGHARLLDKIALPKLPKGPVLWFSFLLTFIVCWIGADIAFFGVAEARRFGGLIYAGGWFFGWFFGSYVLFYLGPALYGWLFATVS